MAPREGTDNVILRSQPKNFRGLTCWDYKILRGVYPGPAEGLTMPTMGFRGFVRNPFRRDPEASVAMGEDEERKNYDWVAPQFTFGSGLFWLVGVFP